MREAILLGTSHILTMAPYYALMCALFWRQRRWSKRATVLAMAAFSFAHSLSSFLLMLAYGRGAWSNIQFAFFCVGCVAIFLLLFRVQMRRVVYVFMLIRALYITITYIMLNAFMLVLPGQYIGLDDTPLFTLAVLLGTGVVFPFLWKYFTGRLRDALMELDGTTILRLCVTPALFFLLDQCYSSIRATLEYENFQTAAIFFLILVTGLATYYINLKTVLDTTRRVQLEGELQTQLALQAQGYENLTQSIEAARAARHDVRHHLNVIQDYAAQGDTEGLRAYLAEYTAALPSDDVPDYCENRTVNVLLRHYLTLAKQAGAALDVKIGLPAHAGIPDADLCVVFGNLFENAAKSIAAQTDGDKYIRARCSTGPGDITLTLENSVGGAAPGEGVGLKSVEGIAKKHDGSARFEKQGAEWFGSVMLMKAAPADSPGPHE